MNKNTTNENDNDNDADDAYYYAEMGFTDSDIYYKNQEWAILQHEQQTPHAKRFFSLTECGL